MEKISMCLLVSGELGYLSFQHLMEIGEVRIHSVLTNRNSQSIIDLCVKESIPLFTGNPRGGVTRKFFEDKGRPDVLLSINYLFLIEKDLIELPRLYAINIHGSLLPKYRGRTPHIWAIINGETVTGVTAHIITEECDKGDILFQVKVPIGEKDTGGQILESYTSVYPILIDKIIKGIESKKLSPIQQNEVFATYFPRRTPDEGEINWNWQKIRIYNWVRALAPPEYPGAFFFFNGKKIIVQKLEFSDIGFDSNVPNGTILSHYDREYLIKTPNGCVIATEVVHEN